MIAEAFAMLDAKRSQGPSSPAAVPAEAIAAVVEAAESPAQTTAVMPSAPDEDASLDEAVKELADFDLDEPSGAPAESNHEDEMSALDAALEADGGAQAGDDEQAAEPESSAPVDGEDHSFDDAFDLLEEMTHEPSDVPGLQEEADNDAPEEEEAKKSKLPLVVGLVAVIAVGGYFATSGGSGASDPLAGDDPAAKALRSSYEKGLEALASGEVERMNTALASLEPAMCLKGCDFKQCVKGEKGGCEIDPNAAAITPFFLLYDRLWLEANQTDPSLQAHAGSVLKSLQGKAEAPFGKERLSAVADHWNAIQPTVDPTSNKSAVGLQSVLGAIPQAADTTVLIALKQLEGEKVGEAAKLLNAKPAEGQKAPDARLVNLSKARLARAEAATKGCAPINEAYLAAVKAGLPAARRELALFLATNGDAKGAALAAGEAAGSDLLLKAVAAAAALGPEASDAQLKAKFAAQNKKTLRSRKGKKIIGFLYESLSKNKGPTQTRGNLLAGIQEMFPNALKELMEGAWIAVALGQAAEGEAKAAHGAEAMKRFERALAVDPNRRDALLGRAASALLVGKGEAHRADAFTWLLSQSAAKPLCAAKAAPAKEAGK